MPQEKIRPPINIHSDSEFFIAICKRPQTTDMLTVHSFITVGVHDKASNENHILCGIGKYFNSNVESDCRLLKATFNSIPSGLQEENFLFRDDSISITYKAFTISENQYICFLDQLKHALLLKPTGAYERATENKSEQNQDNDLIKYEFKEFENNVIYLNTPINKSVTSLSIRNTCRDSAKQLLNIGLGKEYNRNDVPTFFLSNLPCETTINKGKILGNIFIFPAPPNKENLSPELYAALTKIYQQLENISKSYLHNEKTMQKFLQLKALYLDLDKRKEENNIFTFLQVIEEWDKNNKQLIDEKRGFSLYRTTATRDMVTDITNTLTPKAN